MDAEGLDAVSMRRVAREVGVEAMSLYNHVRNKEDLLDGIVDVVVGEIDLRPSRDHWKPALRHRLMTARTVLLRHPWAPRVIESRRTMSPVMVRYLESLLGILRTGGFSVDQTHHALHILGSRILGFTQDLFGNTGARETSPEVAAIMAREMAQQYPYITELALSVSHDGALGGCDDDLEFALGLDLILDGLERMLDRETGAAPEVRTTTSRNEPDLAVARAVAELRKAAAHATDRDLRRQLRATFVELLDSALDTPQRQAKATRG